MALVSFSVHDNGQTHRRMIHTPTHPHPPTHVSKHAKQKCSPTTATTTTTPHYMCHHGRRETRGGCGILYFARSITGSDGACPRQIDGDKVVPGIRLVDHLYVYTYIPHGTTQPGGAPPCNSVKEQNEACRRWCQRRRQQQQHSQDAQTQPSVCGHTRKRQGRSTSAIGFKNSFVADNTVSCSRRRHPCSHSASLSCCKGRHFHGGGGIIVSSSSSSPVAAVDTAALSVSVPLRMFHAAAAAAALWQHAGQR